MKIYTGTGINKLLTDVRKIDLILYHEKDKWEFVDNMDDADIIALLRPPYEYEGKIVSVSEQLEIIGDRINSKWLLLLMHTHLSESMHGDTIEFFQSEYPTDKLLVVSVNRQEVNDRYITLNFQKNLVKIYYTKRHEYDEKELFKARLWFQPLSGDSFRYQEITEFNPSKKFLIPNVVRLPPEAESETFKMIARQTLADNVDKEQSHYSDFINGVYLLPEEESVFKIYEGCSGVGFCPIASRYYKDSIVSVFVETIGKGPARLISEKSYLPLFHGHYILPFGYAGLIKDIRDEGFILPEWIDYNYDLIDNDEQRLNEWLRVFNSLKQRSLEELTSLANRDIDILKHNRNLIIQEPIDSLYDKVKLATGL